ncbi:flagellar transcriptional activator FlhD [Enterobacter sp. BIGb0383]|uniref:flagellar transcriptional regulator FlhD n=1 Tax=unclassified Enterobacter TaxID=2608935 RepID=UPI000F46061B|nr:MULTISPECIES: flagellar transcriptional regulator FlhD [unclassified Enterobacter]ROP58292.1 flagellar transcriptional activator FlhD [Enterobacter sp. BIGb0383]ROS06820.1 flagellar transcriptional activator FlhD [Enterobacter sp. BIGb0359]
MPNIEAQYEQVQNINDLNLSYLMLAQSLIKQDKNAACFRLGLTDSLMELLKNLSAPQLIKLASTNQLICQLRINSEAVIDCLTKDSRIDALQRVHTGIILSTDLLHSLSNPGSAE